MAVQPANPDLKARLRGEASSLGLDSFGVVSLSGVDQRMAERLRTFLELERHGGMAWMAANAERRADPRLLWPEAHTAIMVGLSYAPDHDPLAALKSRSHAAVSVYARGRDYHDVLKAKIKTLAHCVQNLTGASVKVFVDTAPLMEKPLAAAAGLGWQGKHTNLVSRTHGSWLFLGAILTTAQIEADTGEPDHCGSCSACLDICPTRAFPAPYQLDARRCLAYLSIEHKGHIAEEFRKPMANRVFGCDDCLAVCPWNKFASATAEIRFHASEEAANLPLADLLALDDASFRKRFSGTPVKRTGRDSVVRNALIAAGNSGDPSLLGAVRGLLSDPSPLVRAMAVWALYALGEPAESADLRARFEPLESDAAVLAEWRKKAHA